MNKRQKKKHGLLYSQRLGKKLDQLSIDLKEVAARASALVDENSSLRRTVSSLENYTVRFSVDRQFGARNPMIAFQVLIHPMEFKLGTLEQFPKNVTLAAQRVAYECAQKIERVLVKFVETGEV